MPKFNPFTSNFDYTGISESDTDARYLKLDTTNDPLTGNLDISKADPEYRLTDTGDSEYARWTRSDTSSVMQLFNRVEKPGATGYALTFDGNGDYAQAASGINYASTESHTFEAWIYPTAVPSQYGWVINNGSAGNLGTSLIVRSQDGGVTFKISFFYQGGNGVTTATTNLSLNTWQHIAAVYDQSTNKVTFYLNGTADGESGTLGSWSGGTTPVKLGMFDSNHYFTGRIDEPRIYNAALSAADILAKYNSGNGTYGTSGDANIVYGWHLDENTGTTAASFATANTLTLNGNATWADGKVNAPATTIEVSGIKIEDGVGGLEGGIITLGDDQSSVRIEGSAITFNEDGDDTDIRFESDSDANLLFLDGGTDNVGFGTASPGAKVQINPISTTKKGLLLKLPASYTANVFEVQPSASTVPALAVDSSYKLQWGDGAGTAADTNLYRSAANTLKTDDNFVGAGTGSFANGIVPRVVTAADDSTAVIDVDVTDQYQLTAMANATTISTTGTPVAGQKLIIRLKDNGTSRALTWDGVFRAVGVTLPTATTISKTLYIGCVYNLTDTKWDAIAVALEA